MSKSKIANKKTSAARQPALHKANVVGSPLRQREIKFRLWDKLKKEMIFEGFHVFGEVTLFNAIGTYAYETKGERTSLERYNDFEIMQFSGLKDGNGVEIYEGDIIRFDLDIDGFDFQVVFFQDGCFVCGNYNEPLSVEVADWGKKLVVVGNVFQTPELLEKL